MQERRKLEPTSRILRTVVLTGTHAWGVGYAGTISFPVRFAGTPVVTATLMRGSSGIFRDRQFSIPSRYSGSFTYYGSMGHGTFQWIAVGPGQPY